MTQLQMQVLAIVRHLGAPCAGEVANTHRAWYGSGMRTQNARQQLLALEKRGALISKTETRDECQDVRAFRVNETPEN